MLRPPIVIFRVSSARLQRECLCLRQLVLQHNQPWNLAMRKEIFGWDKGILLLMNKIIYRSKILSLDIEFSLGYICTICDICNSDSNIFEDKTKRTHQWKLLGENFHGKADVNELQLLILNLPRWDVLTGRTTMPAMRSSSLIMRGPGFYMIKEDNVELFGLQTDSSLF